VRKEEKRKKKVPLQKHDFQGQPPQRHTIGQKGQQPALPA